MFDWTKKTDNPDCAIGSDFYIEMLNFINSIRVFKKQKYHEFLKDSIKNKYVLDIGVVEHDITHINRKGWLHKFVKDNSKYCVGVDNLCESVEILNKKGYKVYCMDATSDAYLGEKFDIVLLGNVIAHVNNPVNLIKFAKRHLKDGGEIIIDTPNPYFYRHIKRNKREKTLITNFEIVNQITPALCNEIARRAGVIFDKHIYFLSKKSIIRRFLQRKFPEKYTGGFVYIFKNKSKLSKI